LRATTSVGDMNTQVWRVKCPYNRDMFPFVSCRWWRQTRGRRVHQTLAVSLGRRSASYVRHCPPASWQLRTKVRQYWACLHISEPTNRVKRPPPTSHVLRGSRDVLRILCFIWSLNWRPSFLSSYISFLSSPFYFNTFLSCLFPSLLAYFPCFERIRGGLWNHLLCIRLCVPS
jgi:hypothetical protein